MIRQELLDRGQGGTASRLRPSPFARRVGIGFVALVMLAPATAVAQYLPEQIYEFQNLGNSLGYSSAAGDVNGDGRDDLVLGAVFDDISNASSYVCNAGSVTIITGGSSNPQDWKLVAEIFNPDSSSEGAFGYSVAVGDVNGDNRADVIVGAPLADAGGLINAGSVFVYLAPNWTTFATRANGTNPQDNFGTSVAVTGDIDGDGRNDVVVGAPRFDRPGLTNAGRVYGFSLPLQGTLTQQWTTDGQAMNELFGRSLDGGGRLVAGGPRRDVLAGAPGQSAGSGSVRALRGSDGAIIGSVTTSGSVRFGEAVRFIPDLNNDGLDDSLIGIPGSDQVSLFLAMGGSPSWTLTGSAGSEFGAAIMSLTNIVGDAGFEFAVGAPSFGSGSGLNRGRVEVYQPNGIASPSLYLQFTGTASGDRFGFSLSRANITGTGSQRNDLVVGAPFADGRNIAESGVVTAYDITTLPETQLASLTGTFSGFNFGEALAFRRAGTLDTPLEDWIVIGMPSADLPAPLGTIEETCDSGRVFVYSGDGVFRYSLAAAGPAERFGTAVAAVDAPNSGDVADDYIVVGAPRAIAGSSSVMSGVIRIFRASDGLFLCERSPDMDEGGNHFDADYGSSITRLGDVILDFGGPDDGEEIAVGAPLANAGFVSSGKVYIYTVRSNPCSLLLRAILVAPPGLDHSGAQFGLAVSGPGDLDTGLAHPPAEILVGAPGQIRSNMQAVGEAYIFDANPAGSMINALPRATLISGDPQAGFGDFFGAAISGAGTFMGSGPDFVAVGVPGGVNTSGALRVGRVEIFTAGGGFVASILNPNPNPAPNPLGLPESFGNSLAEVDLPGSADDGFLVGDARYFNGEFWTGRAYFYSALTVSNVVPFSDSNPPPVASESPDPTIYSLFFGAVVAHSPNTLSSAIGRSMISAIGRDVEDSVGYRSESPRIHVDAGRVYLFDYTFQPISVP